MLYQKIGNLADIKFCTISPSRAKEQDVLSKWLACANFLSDNTVLLDTVENYNVPDDDWLLRQDDIVLKRITPTFINYIDFIPENMYCGNNLIIISPSNQIYSRYLAMWLNDKVKDLSVTSSVGAVMKSISRTDLEELEIPIPDYEKQVLLGNLWYDSIELKKKKARLIELEDMKNLYILNKYVHSLGGKENGKDNI